MAREKKKKIHEGDGFSIGGSGSMNVTLASALGYETKGSEHPVKDDKSQGKTKAQQTKAGGASAFAGLSRATLQRRSAGCGGKTVTIVILPSDCLVDPEAAAKEMRRGLGCGSRVEDGRIVLQGDIVDRAEQWLAAHGVKRVVLP